MSFDITSFDSVFSGSVFLKKLKKSEKRRVKRALPEALFAAFALFGKFFQKKAELFQNSSCNFHVCNLYFILDICY